MGTWENVKKAAWHWALRRLPSCEEVLPMISDSMDRTLPLRQRFSMHLHNLICVWCMRYARQLRLMRDMMRATSEVPEESAGSTLSAEARERIKNSLKS